MFYSQCCTGSCASAACTSPRCRRSSSSGGRTSRCYPMRLYAEKLRAIHFHAQTAAMGEAALGALPADEHQFLASLQRLLAKRKSP